MAQTDPLPLAEWSRPWILPGWPWWAEEATLGPSNEGARGLSIYEDERGIHIEAAFPGVDPKDIEVTCDHGTLWMRGKARTEQSDQQRRYYRRTSQVFSYRLAIPENADPAATPQVTYKNAIITATFPKAPSGHGPQRIPVTMA